MTSRQTQILKQATESLQGKTAINLDLVYKNKSKEQEAVSAIFETLDSLRIELGILDKICISGQYAKAVTRAKNIGREIDLLVVQLNQAHNDNL